MVFSFLKKSRLCSHLIIFPGVFNLRICDSRLRINKFDNLFNFDTRFGNNE